MTDGKAINSRYRLQNKLGEGGMGVVYRAFDRLTGQTVALKQVTVAGDQLQFASQSTDQDFSLSLALEFRTLAGLRHPHIVSVLDYGFDEQPGGYHQPYFAMELVEEAKTLTEYARTLDLPGKVQLLSETLEALTYLHRHGIIHRDLKPANVLVTPEGAVKVMDFGLVLRQSDSSPDLHGNMVGTTAYMAPEQFKGASASVASDLYAVGMMAYEILVGNYPYKTTNIAVLLTGILHERPDTTSLDLDLAEVIDRLLAKTPEDRYSSPDAVIKALYTAVHLPPPPEDESQRESFLQAARFVGREAELERLLISLNATTDEQGAAWLTGGESGVGKSRLLDELRTRALVAGALVVRGQAVEGGGLPYQLWRDPLRRLILSTNLSDLEAGVLKPLIPDVGQLLGREIADIADLPGKSGQQRLISTIAEVFKRQSRTVVLLLEDLQWSGESVIPLKQLNELAKQLRLLIVATYRDDEAPGLPDELPGMQVMKLSRFSDDEITELSTSMLGDAGKQSKLVELLKRETEGNTFFMVEVVRSLAEEAGRLDEISLMTLPASVMSGGMQQIIRRQLNRVPETMSELLKLAAVAGRQPDFKVLNNIHTASLEPFITACAEASVLEIIDREWRFAHDKLREAILRDLQVEEHSRLHRQVAEAIEQTYPDNAAYVDILLEHWHQAGNVEKMLDYTLLSCERKVNYMGDYVGVRKLLDRGLMLLERTPPGGTVPGDDFSPEAHTLYRAKLLRLLGLLQARQGDYAGAKVTFDESLKLASGDRPTMLLAMLGLCHVAYTMGDHTHAIASTLQALELAEQIQAPASVAECLSTLGGINRFHGDHTAARNYLERSLTIQRQIGNRRGEGVNLMELGILDELAGDYALAQMRYEQNLAIRREIGDQRGVLEAVGFLGLVAYARKEYQQARDYLEQSV
ncbi:MAG TPA: protein kinase, partial [Phototrophicaceae bacterium]|nr:protein kinase [Phototrophicaceae bacterium]